MQLGILQDTLLGVQEENAGTTETHINALRSSGQLVNVEGQRAQINDLEMCNQSLERRRSQAVIGAPEGQLEARQISLSRNIVKIQNQAPAALLIIAKKDCIPRLLLCQVCLSFHSQLCRSCLAWHIDIQQR
jgi:hypothetical protein